LVPRLRFPHVRFMTPSRFLALQSALGGWDGSLTYRDYQKPDQLVTLKSSMIVSPSAPDELTLYYEFDDGPGKTVYSDERMKFDLPAGQLVWPKSGPEILRSRYEFAKRIGSN
jgi:hypothetical protein